MVRRWKTEIWEWFGSENENMIMNFEGNFITCAQYDKRTPGKFKPEFVGDGMICLNSKVYIWRTDKDGKVKTKNSPKGCQKKRN